MFVNVGGVWRMLRLSPMLMMASQGELWAQDGAGVRTGLSVNPDQFYVGAHLGLGPVVDRLWLRPNLEARIRGQPDPGGPKRGVRLLVQTSGLELGYISRWRSYR